MKGYAAKIESYAAKMKGYGANMNTALYFARVRIVHFHIRCRAGNNQLPLIIHS